MRVDPGTCLCPPSGCARWLGLSQQPDNQGEEGVHQSSRLPGPGLQVGSGHAQDTVTASRPQTPQHFLSLFSLLLLRILVHQQWGLCTGYDKELETQR